MPEPLLDLEAEDGEGNTAMQLALYPTEGVPNEQVNRLTYRFDTVTCG